MLGEDERVAGRPGDVDGAADRDAVAGLRREGGDGQPAVRADEVLDVAPEVGDLLDRRRERIRSPGGWSPLPALEPDRLGSDAELDRPADPDAGAGRRQAGLAAREADDGAVAVDRLRPCPSAGSTSR